MRCSTETDPLAAAAEIVAGYHEVFPLTELELEALYTLICMRLAVSVTNSALQQKLHPDNKYLLVSERPAWALLEKLSSVDPSLLYIFSGTPAGLSLVRKLEPSSIGYRKTPRRSGRWSMPT